VERQRLVVSARTNGSAFDSVSQLSHDAGSAVVGPPASFVVLRAPLLVAAAVLALTGCRTARPLTFAPRKGDEIVVAGRLFHTGTRVVTWMDPGGYDAYRTERRFSPYHESSWEKTKDIVKGLPSPARYGLRADLLTPQEIERVRGGGWDLPTLQRIIDEFVIHFDAAGTSKGCFRTLQDFRGLSVHFMIDLDGTIYQTLDVKERAFQATTANTRSIGVEIANIGAFSPANPGPFADWYRRDEHGWPFVTIPSRVGDPMIFTRNFVARPARAEPVRGTIQGRDLVQYDFTPEQYAALIKLTAALCKVFPKIRCDYPHDANGKLMREKLPDADLQSYQGILGHFHVQTNKVDPGPAFDWDRVIAGARRGLGQRAP
jgi:N-acetylmuramoyl-L-alanine amidase